MVSQVHTWIALFLLYESMGRFPRRYQNPLVPKIEFRYNKILCRSPWKMRETGVVSGV